MADFFPNLWFVLIAVLWLGYLFLEGFDLGVGMFMKLMARDEKERRVLLNTIGPHWDGNEVWLITAGGAMFAAFPLWYAALFSALYLPLALVLVGLIMRATAIEYRGKINDDRWRERWTWAMVIGSFIAAAGIGAGLSVTTLGLPINANGDRVGGAFAWFGWRALIGAAAAVGFALTHASAFLALKTDGEIRYRSRDVFVRFGPFLLLPITAWAVIVYVTNERWWVGIFLVAAVIAIAYAWVAMRAGREMAAFIGSAAFLLAGVVTIFASAWPNVLPSTLDSTWNLTATNAASSDYTLKIMTVIAAFGVPLVLMYQAWSYYVFRRRVSEDRIPDPHDPH